MPFSSSKAIVSGLSKLSSNVVETKALLGITSINFLLKKKFIKKFVMANRNNVPTYNNIYFEHTYRVIKK